MLAWMFLGLAILSGLLAQSAIPPMIKAKNYDESRVANLLYYKCF